MGVFGPTKEMRTQCHFRDDGTIEIRPLEIEDTFLIERGKDGEIRRGWKHFYRNQYPFPGHGKIKPDMVTLSYDRDIILDPFGILENDVANPKNSSRTVVDITDGSKVHLEGTTAWLSEVGEARRLKMMANRGKRTNTDKVILFLGVALMLQIFIIILQVVL